MSEREIAYCRETTGRGPCPLCGTGDVGAYVCGPCINGPLFQDIAALIRTDKGTADHNVITARDAIYDLGVKLRASGRLPPLKKSAACAECGDAECSCGLPVWTYRYRPKSSGITRWYGDASDAKHACVMTRSYLAELHRSGGESWGHEFDFGPIQKVTDPPYEFPKAEPPVNSTIKRSISTKEFAVSVDVANATKGPSIVAISSEAQLARLLWETDPQVNAFCQARSDHRIVDGPTEIVDEKRLAAFRQKMWERHESGWRDEWEERARRVFEMAKKTSS